MTRSLRTALLVSAVVAVFALPACRSVPTERQTVAAPLGEGARCDALLLSGPKLGESDPPWLSFSLGQAMVMEADRALEDRVLLFGPEEEDRFAALASAHRVPKERRCTVRFAAAPSAEGRMVDAALFHDETLIFTSKTFRPGPLGKPDARFAADLVALTAVAKDAFAHARSLTKERPPRFLRSQLSWALSPAAAMEHSDGSRPPAAEEVAPLPYEERLAFRKARAKELSFGLSEDELDFLARSPAGIYFAGPSKTPLFFAGELLTAIDGEPALPANFQRLRVGAKETQVELRDRGGKPLSRVIR